MAQRYFRLSSAGNWFNGIRHLISVAATFSLRVREVPGSIPHGGAQLPRKGGDTPGFPRNKLLPEEKGGEEEGEERSRGGQSPQEDKGTQSGHCRPSSGHVYPRTQPTHPTTPPLHPPYHLHQKQRLATNTRAVLARCLYIIQERSCSRKAKQCGGRSGFTFFASSGTASPASSSAANCENRTRDLLHPKQKCGSRIDTYL